MYIVAHFPDENTYAVIHSNWLVSDCRVRWPRVANVGVYNAIVLSGIVLPESVPDYEFTEMCRSDRFADALAFERQLVMESSSGAPVNFSSDESPPCKEMPPNVPLSSSSPTLGQAENVQNSRCVWLPRTVVTELQQPTAPSASGTPSTGLTTLSPNVTCCPHARDVLLVAIEKLRQEVSDNRRAIEALTVTIGASNASAMQAQIKQIATMSDFLKLDDQLKCSEVYSNMVIFII
ncbi:hypothetical protein D915_008783 [Fasciola hepatica]|uniref:Uncharacterized protein n=1 Tax=Fasciola hepatica TaxID=6192 RepID=A0A4E0RHI8_FASHE|nr:hypothetical protein D915_008783 [Fasciola hepatica]